MILAALIALAAPALAAPENWELVTKANNGVSIYVDKDGFERSGDVIVASERHDYSEAPNAKYREMRVRTAYNCAAHTRQVRSATVTPLEGPAQSMTFSDAESPVDPVRPDTISDIIFKRVCG